MVKSISIYLNFCWFQYAWKCKLILVCAEFAFRKRVSRALKCIKHRDTHSFGMIFFNEFSGSKPIANEICRIDGYRDITNLLAIYIPIWIPLSWISLTNQIYRDYQLSGNSIRSPALALAFGATALERCNWKMERQFSDTHTHITHSYMGIFRVYINICVYIYMHTIYIY